MAQLLAAFADFAVLIQQAIHGSDRTMIDAFVEQGGVDFRRRLIGKARGVQQIQHVLALHLGQRPGRARLGRATGSGVFNRARRRPTVARDTPSAAQTTAVMPLSDGIVATARVKARRRPASSEFPAGPQFFLDHNDCFGAGKAARQIGVTLFQ